MKCTGFTLNNAVSLNAVIDETDQKPLSAVHRWRAADQLPQSLNYWTRRIN